MRQIITASRSDGDRGSSLTTATTVPFYCFDPEEITKAKEKNPIKEDNATKENLVAKKPDAGKASVLGGPTSPTEIPGCFINEVHTKSKRRYVWRRVKQLVDRSMPL